ncbi:MAG TPA: PQQ-binding-like beta-propeller repeat protein [Verrucomicrobiota bacterium]|nr:PQQ-binding-like beta-propeller repeat protein [Verrucomicrobiota bacterium]HNT14895.1 PQQ-binding-like beta-propeller repeat protein [Verrucomicrobiota bacterium]
MKIVCDCGVKYAFDVTEDNRHSPVTFTCPNCGRDLSGRINQLIRDGFAAPKHEEAAGAGAVSSPSPTPQRPPLRIQLPSPTGSPQPVAPAPVGRGCARHPAEAITQQCCVCGKGLCAKCARLFDGCCSPLCKARAGLSGREGDAGARGAGAKSGRRRRFALLVKLGLFLVLLILGAWLWYVGWGSRPRPMLTLRFDDDPAGAGTSVLAAEQQVIFLHGSKLGRCDLATKTQVWRQSVLDEKAIRDQAEQEIRGMQAMAAEGQASGTIPSLDQRIQDRRRAAERALELRVFGHSIWVGNGGSARQFDWATGRVRREVAFAGNLNEARLQNGQLEIAQAMGAAAMQVTRLDLVDGKLTTEQIGTVATGAGRGSATAPATSGESPRATASAVGTASAPLSAQELGGRVADSSTPGKLAAPATIAVARRQQEADRLLAGDDDGQRAGNHTVGSTPEPALTGDVTVLPAGTGFIGMTVRLLQRNIVSRSAMRAAPARSALNGQLSAGATADAANELLNEMARNAGEDKVEEDQSRYRVRLHRFAAGAVPDWEGEVTGAPELYPQSTVNVLIAGTSLIVLDQHNHLRWESRLMYPIAEAGVVAASRSVRRYGSGPVVEHGQTLYVFDQGVLSAFDLATGTARWRLPSVGVTGVFFDDAGALYVNTTTASPERIQYARQIDVNERTGNLTLKLDANTGRERWRYAGGGWLAYVAGRYLYAVDYTPPREEGDADQQTWAAWGLEAAPHLNIRRLNPKNGRVIWDYYQPRGAWDVQMHDNLLLLVLKREVQILKFLTL